MNNLFSNSSGSLIKLNRVLVYLISLHKYFLNATPFTESSNLLHQQFANSLSLIVT